jgi:hypothetical protein
MKMNQSRTTDSSVCSVVVFFNLLIAGWTQVGASSATDIKFFEKNVRPLLVKNCYDCHSSESGKSKGGLLLDTREGWATGGDSGPTLIPADPEKSLLIKAVHYDDPDIEMPPDGKLPDHEIKILEDWIRSGAHDPRTSSIKKAKVEIDIGKGKEFWAFQQPSHFAPPPVRDTDWPQDEIDFFILSQLEAAGLQPNPTSTDEVLIRRLYFDLIGLPPTPDQIAEALSLPSATRTTDLVDRLLASKHFGETWARHWLDLARYSESTGGGRSALLPTAWRYRNYVIDSFNNDKPFDQFIREQIAGDLLPYQSDSQRAEQLTATAFLVLGPKNLDLQDKELLRMNTVDEQIDTVGRVFMGLTISCARCHDHKFDPIPAKDYYALAGIFRSTRTLKRSNVSTLTHRELPTSDAHRESVNTFNKSKKTLETQIKKLKTNKTKSKESSIQLTSLETNLKDLLTTEPNPIPQTLGVIDEAETANYNLCVRGNVHQLAEEVPRSFVQVMMESPDNHPNISEGQSGRLELADWLSHEDHPLAARVIVNRIWGHLFGEGLVRTVDNFGIQGERPSHPELLDYLATSFVSDHWSIKRLIRRIVLTRSYQLNSDFTLTNASVDAENRLLWRMPRRRLTAEAVRDSMLAISGGLMDQTVECLFPRAAQRDTALQKASLDVAALVNPPLRSVYIPVLREEGLNPLLKAFDFANPSFPVGKRNRSILPTQALFLMNSEFVMQKARQAADQLLTKFPDHNSLELLNQAYLTVIGRRPLSEEQDLALAFLNDFDMAKEDAEMEVWSHLYHSLFATVDFRFLK